ncbi:MAG: endonuclease/exonuclease/phosphatase family protein [bacterium]
MEKMKFKFITLNLWFGGVLFDAILDFLKKENPDILACQEIYDSKDLFLDKRYRSFGVLKNELKYGWASFAPTFSDELVKGKSEQGNAIFSRFPIISSKTIFYDVPYSANYLVPLTGPFYVPRNLQQAAIKAGDIEFNIFNTQGIWGTDGKDNERRLKMGQIIAGAVKGKENAILAGDFNIEPATETIAKIKKHLKSVFENELTTSFNMKRKDKPGFAEAVADQVFASENIKVVEHYCPQADISDHLPLVCVFEV